MINNFGKQLKPFFLKNLKHLQEFFLKNKDKAISNDSMVAKEFSSFFENATKSLNISPRTLTLGDATNSSNPEETAIKKFENHPSVQIIKERICIGQEFDFEQLSIDEILKEMKNLDNKNNGTFNNKPSNHLKEVSEVTAPYLTNIWNTQIITGQTFPDNLKLADITHVFKKRDSNLTKNHRPVSVLTIVSNIFERQLQKEIISYIDQFSSKLLFG